MRRTKIVATVGPATAAPGPMRQLLEAGVDVVRLNAAHADMDTHSNNARQARELAQVLGRSVGVLVDLPGPKIRSGLIVGDAVELESGQEFVLSGHDDGHGDAQHVATTLPALAQWARRGDDVYLADGAIVLRVLEAVGDDVRTEVVRGGTLRSRKGMHLPRAEEHVDPFTDRDARALEMAVAAKVDFLGLSFVRRAEDVEQVRALLPRRGMRPALIAKIETASAVDNLAGIINAADGVMVARGDLGIQMPARRVPLLQKEIIRFCNQAGKPVITATQMLESMTRSPLPTRAEVNDVANAVLDGTDALMLSEETAVGLFPGETVRMMSEVAESAEGWPRLTALIRSQQRRRRFRPGGVGGGARRGAGGRRPRRGGDPVSDAQRSNGASRRRLPAAGTDRRHLAQPAGARRALPGVGRATAGSPRKPQRRGTDTARDRGRTGGGHRPRRRSGGARFRLGRAARRQHRQRTHRARLRRGVSDPAPLRLDTA